MNTFKKIRQVFRDYFQKALIKEKFNGIYPFDLDDIHFTKHRSFGEKNPDKIFYVIYRNPMGAGFFSNFAHVVRQLKLIEGKGFTPVVDFQNFKTHYNVDNAINGTKNAWEYYFEQVSPYSLEEVYQSKHVLFCDGTYPLGVEFKEDELYEYFTKTFKVKQDVADILTQYEKEFLNKKVLGIHFRGKDMNIFPEHPFGATEKQMFKYTDEIIEKYGVNKIFIATDEKKYLENYKKRYGDIVFYADNFKTDKLNDLNQNSRENHRYLLGREVLIDLLLLLKCQGLLHGSSNVANTAKILNPNYEFTYFINNGSNSPNMYFARYLYGIKKRLPKNFGGLLDKIEVVVNNT